MGAALTPPLVGGNSVQALVNGGRDLSGDAAARSARRSSRSRSRPTSTGRVRSGTTSPRRWSPRPRRGVRIKVLLDWFGSSLDEDLLERMRGGGIDIQRYNAPAWHNLQRMNHRTHRRLMVIDGRVGFIGGAGLGDKWSGDAQGPEHWRDSHFRVEGPVVTQMQAAFIDNWIAATGEVLHSLDFLPRVADSGSSPAQLFTASPGGGAKSMQLMYLMAISSATGIDRPVGGLLHSRRGRAAVARRRAAARRAGPHRRCRAPHMDSTLVRHASRALWGELLAQRRRDPRIPADDVPLQGDGRRCAVGVGRFDQLRLALVQHQRRGQPERLRRGVRPRR